jgi:tetratricopeptide (TPR) repeat protein
MAPASSVLKQAVDLHRAGRLDEAEAGYRRVLVEEPGNPDALHFLGLVAYQSGRAKEAVDLIRRAIAIRAKPAYWYNLGHAYLSCENYPAAEEAFRQTVLLAPTHAEALFHLGNMLRARDDKEGAIDYYRRAAAAKPDFADAHANLGLLTSEIGEAAEAIQHLERAHQLRPDNLEFLVNLGVARTRVSAKQARADFQRVLALKPDHFNARLNLAKVLAAEKLFDEAIPHYEAVLAQHPDDASLHIALADALSETHHAEAAAPHYEAAIAAAPMETAGYLGLAQIYRRNGRFEDAYNFFLKVRELNPDNVAALAGIATYLKARLPLEDADRIAKLADSEELSDEQKRHLHFALSECRDKAGHYDAAFYHMTMGNKLRAAELEEKVGRFDAARVTAVIDCIIADFDADYFRRAASFGVHSDLPVFVVGMPRSGTTLCEQILASHSQVFGADELEDIPRFVRDQRLERLGKPQTDVDGVSFADSLTAEIVSDLADRHLARLQSLSPRARRIVDKMPGNYHHLGFIATLFPRAKIIHCRRDPLDTCLSCFAQDFGSLPIWTNDLRATGHVYKEYQRLMAHWRQVLPIQFLDFDYAAVVADVEAAARRLIEFCGLDWEEGCLEFYRTQRMVKTASLEQVRRPIYDSSVGRWRKYERHLGPLREVLGLAQSD